MKYQDPELGWIDTDDPETIKHKIKLANPMNDINRVFDKPHHNSTQSKEET